MEMCVKCGQRPAVMYITKMESGKSSMAGYCLSCAKELGLAPIDDMLTQFGIDDDQIEMINDQMTELIDSMGGPEALQEAERNMLDAMQNRDDADEDTEGGAMTAPLSDFMNNIFGGGMPFSKSPQEEEPMPGDSTPQERRQRQKRRGKKSVLDTYGTDLTAKAALGEVDRVVGRNAEVDRVIQILNRRQKNNPVLLGEPGVGKTAVAEGLAMRIFEKNVPPKLFDARLYLIDFAAMVAGTQFRGQFEARLKSLLSEAAERGNVIMVIDEIHNIVAAGDAEGAMSAANILKPALARGEIQIIGATTLTEYRKHIEKDTALERRFQPVLVDEPSIEESIEILKGIKDYYEKFHSVKISDEIIAQTVRMSERYITDRFLPDKAIDIIDEAGSRVNLRNKALYELTKLENRYNAIDAEIEEINGKTENPDIYNYEKIANLRSEKLRLEQKRTQLQEEAKNSEITFDDIAAVIEAWTKIPVHRLTEDESQKLLQLEDRIHERVIGQDEAVKAVSQAIRRGRADITSRKRPVSFIFAGPTGVGKTELVKTIAEVMFGDEEALVRIDMSEYMEKHAVSKLIGSPPGYVGYDDAGQLTEKIRRKPYSVILLDEIEKAHPDVFNVFLQILDDGRIADSHGKIVNFENTIIVMTTNSGTEFNANRTGFNRDTAITMKDNVEKSLKQFFKPEFLNRIDDIVTFKPLEKPELKQIIDLLLKDIKSKLAEKNVDFTITEAAKDLVLDKGYDVQYGARPLKRSIQMLIEDKLAQLSLTGKIKEDSVVVCDRSGEEVSVTVAAFE